MTEIIQTYEEINHLVKTQETHLNLQIPG